MDAAVNRAAILETVEENQWRREKRINKLIKRLFEMEKLHWKWLTAINMQINELLQ